MSADPAFIAVMLVSLVVLVGLLVYCIAVERSTTRKIDTILGGTKPGTTYHFECTCGWHGWRQFIHQPVSIKCPRCNGVAVQLNYREREL